MHPYSYWQLQVHVATMDYSYIYVFYLQMHYTVNGAQVVLITREEWEGEC